MNECFVCTLAHEPLYKVCRCNTLVHEACFLKLVNVPSHATHCAVCREKYDITVSWRTHLSVNTPAIIFFTIGFFLATGILISLVLVRSADAVMLRMYHGFMTFLLVSVFTTILCSWYFMWRRTGRCCFVWSERIADRTLLQLPAPITPSSQMPEKAKETEMPNAPGNSTDQVVEMDLVA